MESVREAVSGVLWKSNSVVQLTLCDKCPVLWPQNGTNTKTDGQIK
jgi:hypothetical protein